MTFPFRLFLIGQGNEEKENFAGLPDTIGVAEPFAIQKRMFDIMNVALKNDAFL